MPLLKLWNSLVGRSKPAEDQSAGSAELTVNAAPTAKSASRKSTNNGGRSTKGLRLSLFGGGGPHGTLCKLVKPLQAKAVLEVSVGDGSRAIAVLEALGTAHKVRYVAIDQFEMAGGDVTLKAFHKTLRREGIRPQVYPEPINRGLVRVANTIGPVDLVIIAAEQTQWQTPETMSLLARVSHSETVVLFQDEESWERFEPPVQSEIRRAA